MLGYYSRRVELRIQSLCVVLYQVLYVLYSRTSSAVFVLKVLLSTSHHDVEKDLQISLSTITRLKVIAHTMFPAKSTARDVSDGNAGLRTTVVSITSSISLVRCLGALWAESSALRGNTMPMSCTPMGNNHNASWHWHGAHYHDVP